MANRDLTSNSIRETPFTYSLLAICYSLFAHLKKETTHDQNPR